MIRFLMVRNSTMAVEIHAEIRSTVCMLYSAISRSGTHRRQEKETTSRAKVNDTNLCTTFLFLIARYRNMPKCRANIEMRNMSSGFDIIEDFPCTPDVGIGICAVWPASGRGKAFPEADQALVFHPISACAET